MERRAATFDSAFPKLFGARASAKLAHETSQNDEGEEYQTYSVDVIVPRRCRVAAIFEPPGSVRLKSCHAPGDPTDIYYILRK